MKNNNIRLLLLDRDGVINRDLESSVKTKEEFQLIDGAIEAIARLTQKIEHVAIITNQAVVGRGEMKLEVLNSLHQDLCEQVKQRGGSLHFDDIFVCTSTSNEDWRRKPNPGMIEEALQKFAVKKEEAVMVGDDVRDLEAAERAGVAFILVLSGKGHKTLQAVGNHRPSRIINNITEL